ncbi:MAG: HD domain-containing protein [Dictyoglomus turgidum]
MTYLILVLMLTGIFILFYALFGDKLKKKSVHTFPSNWQLHPVQTVKLSALSHIWLKYNKTTQEIQPEKIEEASQETVKVNTFNILPAPMEKFVSDIVSPHMKAITEQGAKTLTEELIKLLVKHADVPSIVLSANDKESQALMSVKTNLAKVGLMEHSIGVTTRLIELVKDTYIDPWQIIPEAIVVGLGHDIGKIPEFITGQYNTWEHPMISELKVAELVKDNPPLWIDHARSCIREHHLKNAKDQLTQLLQEADRDTRMVELMRTLEGYSIKDFDSWFSPEEFVKEIEPLINVSQTSQWGCFTYRGIAYAKPNIIWECAENLRHKKKALDKDFVYSSDTTNAIKKTVEALRQINLIAPICPEGYHSRRFKVTPKSSAWQGKSYTMMLTPLRLDIISSITGVPIAQIEARKTGVLEILEVIPD